jgi:hypothetical protein
VTLGAMLPRGISGAIDPGFKRDTRAMTTIDEALRAGQHTGPVRRVGSGPHALVAGGGGALGSAVVEGLLGSHRFGQVDVLVTQPLKTALRGLYPLMWPGEVSRAATALIVFDRERHAHGRERAFLRPDPVEVVALASHLRSSGVRHLLLVMPHAPGSLPDALRAGLADLDEHAVSALGFEHLLIMRSAQASADGHGGSVLQRLAHTVLRQLAMMIPQRDQPVRAAQVARFVVELAIRLPQSPPGTRVVPPEIVWQAGQLRNPSSIADDWLSGRVLPPTQPPSSRM